MTSFTAAPIDAIVVRRGLTLRRRVSTVLGARRQPRTEILWQAATASPDYGYWYSTARQAAAESNASDRVVSL